MDKNVRAKQFNDWAQEQKDDPEFLFEVYREMDKTGPFPPGMDMLSVQNAPAFVKMAGSGVLEGPTVMSIILKMVGAYERALFSRWEEREAKEKES